MPGIQKVKTKSLKGYIVDGELFRRKKDVIERVQEILYDYELEESLNSRDFSFILDLLNNHARAVEKIGCSVTRITVEQNPIFSTKRGFWITRADGTRTDFSFLKCITPATPIQHFRSACRNTIVDQVQEFKAIHFHYNANEQGLVQCPITGEWIDRELAHVDHVQPQTFNVLVNTFIQEQGTDINVVDYKGLEDGSIGRQFANQDLADDWAEYHQQNAKLRVISRIANLSIVKKSDSL